MTRIRCCFVCMCRFATLIVCIGHLHIIVHAKLKRRYYYIYADSYMLAVSRVVLISNFIFFLDRNLFFFFFFIFSFS